MVPETSLLVTLGSVSRSHFCVSRTGTMQAPTNKELGENNSYLHHELEWLNCQENDQSALSYFLIFPCRVSSRLFGSNIPNGFGISRILAKQSFRTCVILLPWSQVHGFAESMYHTSGWLAWFILVSVFSQKQLYPISVPINLLFYQTVRWLEKLL